VLADSNEAPITEFRIGLLCGTLDYAELGSSSSGAVYLADLDAVEPVVTTIQTDGTTGYYSVMLSRADGDIKILDEMKGKHLGFADPNSTSGYLIPSVALPEQGYEISSFFGQTTFSGGHEQNVLAFPAATNRTFWRS
jgi:phosphonate transport system substrate-binding protein